jgi:DNA-directed RNA polymerase subunit F
MENKDKEYMRFIAACFAMTQCASAANAVKFADELMRELEKDDIHVGGIVDIAPKRKRSTK